MISEVEARIARAKLSWNEKACIGFYQVSTPSEHVYTNAYFDKYSGYAATPLGRALTAVRVRLTEKFADREELLDVGIGCGHFIEERLRHKLPTVGYDINPKAIAWLRGKKIFQDLHSRQSLFGAISLWDVLEHLEFPDRLLERARRWVFVSIPIFQGKSHVLVSKHFKTDEHFWYFTKKGLLEWMYDRGFALEFESMIETELGREDIGTFVFKRIRSS